MGSDRLVRAGARMLLAHEAATLVKNVFKTNIDRTRPRSASSRKDKKARKGNSSAKEQSSFPSGHSAGAIAAAKGRLTRVSGIWEGSDHCRRTYWSLTSA